MAGSTGLLRRSISSLIIIELSLVIDLGKERNKRVYIRMVCRACGFQFRAIYLSCWARAEIPKYHLILSGGRPDAWRGRKDFFLLLVFPLCLLALCVFICPASYPRDFAMFLVLFFFFFFAFAWCCKIFRSGSLARGRRLQFLERLRFRV
ncbi:hypothetical protein VTI74DRAFT_11486 [Chaetomium olivicolor]